MRWGGVVRAADDGEEREHERERESSRSVKDADRPRGAVYYDDTT